MPCLHRGTACDFHPASVASAQTLTVQDKIDICTARCESSLKKIDSLSADVTCLKEDVARLLRLVEELVSKESAPARCSALADIGGFSVGSSSQSWQAAAVPPGSREDTARSSVPAKDVAPSDISTSEITLSSALCQCPEQHNGNTLRSEPTARSTLRSTPSSGLENPATDRVLAASSSSLPLSSNGGYGREALSLSTTPSEARVHVDFGLSSHKGGFSVEDIGVA